MRKSLGVVAAVTIGSSLACSGQLNLPGVPGTSGGAHNVEGCKKYVQKMNDAPCNPVDLDMAQLCPDSLNLNPCDMSSYYGCMADAVKCSGDNNGFLDVSGQANCAPSNCN